MKTFLTCGAILLGMASTADAGPTANITGCETRPVANSNATQFVDPNCILGFRDRTGTANERDMEPVPVAAPPAPEPEEPEAPGQAY